MCNSLVQEFMEEMNLGREIEMRIKDSCDTGEIHSASIGPGKATDQAEGVSTASLEKQNGN